MRVSIEHPTDRPNFSIVHLGSNLAIGFSYSTPIAFWRSGEGWVVRENDWGPTTGKHLNHFDEGDKSERLPSAHFEARLHESAQIQERV